MYSNIKENILKLIQHLKFDGGFSYLNYYTHCNFIYFQYIFKIPSKLFNYYFVNWVMCSVDIWQRASRMRLYTQTHLQIAVDVKSIFYYELRSKLLI